MRHILFVLFVICFSTSANVLQDAEKAFNDMGAVMQSSEPMADKLKKSEAISFKIMENALNTYNYNDYLTVRQLIQTYISEKDLNRVWPLLPIYYNMMRSEKLTEEERIYLSRYVMCDMNTSSLQACLLLYNSMHSKKIDSTNFDINALNEFDYYYNINDSVGNNEKLNPILCTSPHYLDKSGFICCSEHGASIIAQLMLLSQANFGLFLNNSGDVSTELINERINQMADSPDQFEPIHTSSLKGAILNFTNNSPDKSLDSLASGFSDLLTTDLISMKCISLVERSRLNTVIDELKLSQTGMIDAKDAAQVGKIAGADLIFTGSFTEFYGRLRIDVKALNPETAVIEDAWQVYGKTDEFFDLESKLVKMIARSLQVKLPDNYIAKSLNAPKSMETMLLFSKALECLKEKNYRDALHHFIACSQKEPSFLLPSLHTLNLSMIKTFQDKIQKDTTE